MMSWTPPESPAKPPIAFRRKPMLLAALCWLLAMPILVMNFVGRIGIGWIVIALSLMVAGSIIHWRERRRVRDASKA